MNEEVLQVQRMVQAGKVTPEDSMELLRSLGVLREPAEDEVVREFRARLAKFSFRLLLVAIAALLIGLPLQFGEGAKAEWLKLVGQLMLETLVVAGVISFILGRTALGWKRSGPQLQGSRWIHAALSPIIVSIIAMATIFFVAPPVLFFVALEDPFLDSGMTIFGRAYVGTDMQLLIAFSAAAFGLLSLAGAWIIKSAPSLPKMVFAPVLNSLESRHSRRLFLTGAIGFTLATVMFIAFLVLRQ